jgi:hypothetical protein
MLLGTICVLFTACQTAGKAPQSEAAAQAQGQSPSSEAAAHAPSPQSTEAAAEAPSPSAEAVAQAQGQSPSSGAARARERGAENSSEGVVVPAITAAFKGLVSGTGKMLTRIRGSVAGTNTGRTRVIEYAALAAIVIAVGATATVRVRRHRKMSPSSN